MKRKLIFLSIITASFSSYASDIVFPQQSVNTQDRRLKGIDKYDDESGTNIIIDKDNNKNTTASIINYKSYSEVNKLVFNISDAEKPVININDTDNKGVSYTVFKQMDIGKKGVYLNNHNSVTPASIIVTEVNGNKMTNLLGKLDILGEEAALIVANPNGIECFGCGFTGTKELTLLAGNVVYTKEKNIQLKASPDKAIIFSGQIDLSNIDQTEIKAGKHIINSNADIKFKDVVYRISNMPTSSNYGINNTNIHFDFGFYGPFINQYKGAEFYVKRGGKIEAENIIMSISGGSFINKGTINNQGLFYFDVYSMDESNYINTGHISTDIFDNGKNLDHRIIENRENGKFEIKYNDKKTSVEIISPTLYDSTV